MITDYVFPTLNICAYMSMSHPQQKINALEVYSLMDITLMAHPLSVQLMSESVYPKYSIDSGTKCHLDVFSLTPASLE